MCNEASYWHKGGLRNCFLFDCINNVCNRELKEGSVGIGLVRETLSVVNIHRRNKRSDNGKIDIAVCSLDEVSTDPSPTE